MSGNESRDTDRITTMCNDCDNRVVVITGPGETLLCGYCGATLYRPDTERPSDNEERA